LVGWGCGGSGRVSRPWSQDNAFSAAADVAGLQRICDELGPAQIRALLDKWQAILPNPFTDADRVAGYDYDLSMLQTEFSSTQKLDTPVSERVLFEQVIRDNLDVGRPDQVGLSFTRRIFRKGLHATPGRVITDGVTRSLHAAYKHTTIKQYHKLRHEVARCERTRRQEGRLMSVA